MQMDQVRPQRRLVGLGCRRIMADVDDVDVLLRHPVERLDPAVIVEVQEVVVWHRLVFADVGALQRRGNSTMIMLSEWLGATRCNSTVSPPKVIVMSLSNTRFGIAVGIFSPMIGSSAR